MSSHSIHGEHENETAPVCDARVAHTQPPRSESLADARLVAGRMLDAALRGAALSSASSAKRLGACATLVDMKRRGERPVMLEEVLVLGNAGLLLCKALVSHLEGSVATGLTPERAALLLIDKAAELIRIGAQAIANDGRIDAAEDAAFHRAMAQLSLAWSTYCRVSESLRPGKGT